MPTLEFERLDVYRCSVDFAVVAERIAAEVPRGRKALQDQLQRASSSIVLNIAEGAGEFSPKDKARFYRMARRSATESAAIIDLLARLSLVNAAPVNEGKALLERIVMMLTKLSLRFEGAQEEREQEGERVAVQDPVQGQVPTQPGSDAHE